MESVGYKIKIKRINSRILKILIKNYVYKESKEKRRIILTSTKNESLRIMGKLFKFVSEVDSWLRSFIVFRCAVDVTNMSSTSTFISICSVLSGIDRSAVLVLLLVTPFGYEIKKDENIHSYSESKKRAKKRVNLPQCLC